MAEEKTQVYTVFTYNCNSDRRCELGYACDTHDCWKFVKRFDRLKKQVKASNADIITLQELDSNSVVLMSTYLREIGYNVSITNYCNHVLAPYLITAIKCYVFDMITEKPMYFSTHPDYSTYRPDNFSKLSLKERQPIIDENFGEEYEKSMLWETHILDYVLLIK
jgi:hypothetical protein